MNQLERIVKMEANLSQAQTAIKKLQEALEVFKKSQPGIEELNKYLVSPEFKIDFKAAENGKLPVGLRHSLLSKNGISKAVTEYGDLCMEMIDNVEVIFKDFKDKKIYF